MQTNYLLSVLVIGLVGTGAFGALGTQSEHVIASKTQATAESSVEVGSRSHAGLSRIGVLVGAVRRWPSLSGKLGFRNAAGAASVLADEGLLLRSSRHALRVHKAEKPGGAWHAALPWYADAARDAGRRGVGDAMFDDSTFMNRRVFKGSSLHKSDVYKFGESDTYTAPWGVAKFSGWQLFTYGGGTTRISPIQRLRRSALRRAVDTLSGGRFTWMNAPRLGESFVDAVRQHRLVAAPQSRASVLTLLHEARLDLHR